MSFVSALVLGLVSLVSAELTGYLLVDFIEMPSPWLTLSTTQFKVESEQLAAQLEQEGVNYYKTGQFELARQTWQRSLQLYREQDNRQAEGNILNELGMVHRALGQYATAITYYQQSLVIQQALNNVQSARRVLGNLGNAYALIGQFELAEEYQLKSLKIAQDLNDPHREAVSLINLGSIYLDQGQHREAINRYEDSISILGKLGNTTTTAYALINLATIYYVWQQDYEKAISHYQQSLKLSRAAEDRWLEAEALSGIGLVNEGMLNYETALAYYDQGLSIFNEIHAKRSAAKALNNRAHTLLAWERALSRQTVDSEKLAEAEHNLQQAIAILEDARNDLNTDANRISLFDIQVNTYNLLQQVLMAQQQPEAALEMSEQGRSRAFLTLFSEQMNIAPTPPNLQQIQQIAKTQNATLVEYSIIPKDDVIHQGKERGNAGELYIWVVTPAGDFSFYRQPLDDAGIVLENLIKISRINIGARNRANINVVFTEPAQTNYALKQLYRLLIDPIQEMLPTDPHARVVFIPQGELFLVPFPALMDADDNYLIANHTVLTAPSIQVLDLSHQLRQSREPVVLSDLNPDQALVVGNPVMPEVWNAKAGEKIALSDLPEAQWEADEIATQLKTQPLLGSAATESTVRQHIEAAQLIHMATHGLLEYGNPQDSGISDIPGAIALAPDPSHNGLLTAAELSEFNLNADLVVLSACDTGLGQLSGDGVIGLARSLMTAGAPSVIVSLWSVPDDSTATLMVRFYDYLQAGNDKAQALRLAMLDTQKKYPDPGSWAAFTLIGAPG
ncbi:CHAT domain-containing protein [Leptolyngbya cf. ectocarpi LEGE 11479]|uniref:CHAT domain-containing protein n=1 Tax=Leptolyngbya cf. ectocarpi LEGE 11479 TaxID=1828722 RepID=A0A928X0P9_LEPEC|nr:CHAT domain-containing tetratricopeptide repeat protein [Leptolyngbya ectocarpi]MBE9066302.1 CHAT domain-containing protein [Leptolyngbya cf. ectocarpi LEGE 11479]